MFKFLYRKWKYLLLILGLSIGVVMAATPEPNRLDKISAIQNTIKIDGIEKIIAWTDNNDGEDFIIKVDAPKYNTWGGDIMIYMSNTLVNGEDQNADTFMSPPEGMFVRSVEKLIGNNIVHDLIEATATTSEQSITRKVTVWEDIEFNKSFKIESSLTRKDTLDRKADQAFNDYFEKGKTNYYRMTVRVPLEVKDKEWFIETIGDGYGHLDPNLWILEDKFNSDTKSTGNLTGQDSWSGSASFQVTTDAVARTEGDQGVKVDAPDGAQLISRDISGIVSGTVYIDVKATETGQLYPFIIMENQASENSFYLGWWNNAQFYCLGSSWGRIGTDTYSANNWDRMGIAFEAGTGAWEGLSADTFKITLDGGSNWSSACVFSVVATTLDGFRMQAYATSENSNYFDYISPVHEEEVEVVEIKKQDIIWFD